MITYLERRWGGRDQNPTSEQLRAALEELKTPDEEHPDCWLSDENGWTIAAFQSGPVVLENVETGDGPWHMTSKSPENILLLWQLLQSGDIDGIRKLDWSPGYGSQV